MPTNVTQNRDHCGQYCRCSAFAATSDLAYECAIGFPRSYDGKRVHRVTRWFPYQPSRSLLYHRSISYFVYMDQDGKEVSHGPMESSMRMAA
jgi:hypothetical protein